MFLWLSLAFSGCLPFKRWAFHLSGYWLCCHWRVWRCFSPFAPLFSLQQLPPLRATFMSCHVPMEFLKVSSYGVALGNRNQKRLNVGFVACLSHIAFGLNSALIFQPNFPQISHTHRYSLNGFPLIKTEPARFLIKQLRCFLLAVTFQFINFR